MALIGKEHLLVGNEKSVVAVCCLWSPKEVYKNVDTSLYHYIGNLYSFEGINVILRNLLSHPQIRKIVVTGNDLNGTGQALISFFEKGVNDKHVIYGEDVQVQKNIPLEDIEALREMITVYDMRKKPMEEIRALLSDIAEEGEFYREVKEIPELKAEEMVMGSEEAGYFLRGDSLGVMWLRLLDLVTKFGEKKRDLFDVTYVFDQPVIKEEILLGEEGGEEELLVYMKLFEGVGEELVGLKEERIKTVPFSFPGNVKKRKGCVDYVASGTLVFSVLRGKLHLSVFIDKQEAYSDFVIQNFCLLKFFEETALGLGLGVGVLSVHVGGISLYEKDLASVKQLLNEQYVHQGHFKKLVQDPRGSFVVSIDTGKLTVQHYSFDSKKTNYFFMGDSVKEVFEQILESQLLLFPDHALYLGKELALAHDCLKRGEKYIQDKA